MCQQIISTFDNVSLIISKPSWQNSWIWSTPKQHFSLMTVTQIIVGEQDLKTWQNIQTRQLCDRVILSYKIYQLISWDIVTMDVSVRINVTRNEAKMKDQLLVHVWCGLRATRCVVEGNVEVSCQCLKFDACYELCVAWLRRIESVSSLPKTHRVLRATRRASQLMNWWIVNENDSLIGLLTRLYCMNQRKH